MTWPVAPAPMIRLCLRRPAIFVRFAASPPSEASRPFCSRRCADVDLNRWLSGVYAIPVTEDEEEDERRDEGPPEGH